MRAIFFTSATLICLLPFLSISQISIEDLLEDIEAHNLVNSNTINIRENDDLLLGEISSTKTKSGYFSDSSTYNYDTNKNIEFKYRLKFDYRNSKWVSSQLYKYEYDEFNNKIFEIAQLWKKDKWINSTKYEYQYNANNDLSLMILSEWEDSIWRFRYSEELMYNANDSLVHKLIKFFNNIKVVQSQNLYKYDISNNKVESLLQHWNGSNWDDSKLIRFYYDSTGLIMSDSTTEWYNTNEQQTYTGEYKYDNSNFLLQYISQEWYENKWINKHNFIYEYDSKHNLIELDFSIGLIWNNDWRLYNSTKFEYNKKNQLIHKYYEDWGQLVKVRTTYYYGELMPSEDHLNKESNTIVYPNPNNGNINIIANQFHGPSHLDVFDASGRNVHSKDITNNDLNHPLNLSHLINGTYYIQLSNGDHSSTQKIIIIK